MADLRPIGTEYDVLYPPHIRVGEVGDNAPCRRAVHRMRVKGHAPAWPDGRLVEVVECVSVTYGPVCGSYRWCECGRTLIGVEESEER